MTQNEIRRMESKNLAIVETADLDDANADGSVTIEPGETVRLVDYSVTNGKDALILAAGATDAVGVEYALRDNNATIAGGWVNSPHGSLNDPFSFVEKYGSVIEGIRRVEYLARMSENQSSPVDLAGRLHLEEV